MNMSDWLQLGAGLQMGRMMTGAIAENFQRANTSPDVDVPLIIPTTRAQIQSLLDLFDLRLATGEFSEEIYKQLTTKWNARLEQAER